MAKLSTTGNSADGQGEHARHHRFLLVIAAFKLLKAILCIAAGVGALKLLHKDVVDLLSQVLSDHNFDSESYFVNVLLDKAALLNDHVLKQISVAFLCYAALDLVEGVGLYLEKTWAEYLTLLLTASFLPFEMYEVVAHITWVRIAVTLINALVVAYLVLLRLRARRLRAA